MANTPLFGCDAAEFRRQFQLFCDLDHEAHMAITARDAAFEQFVEFIKAADTCVLASYMDDVVMRYGHL